MKRSKKGSIFIKTYITPHKRPMPSNILITSPTPLFYGIGRIKLGMGQTISDIVIRQGSEGRLKPIRQVPKQKVFVIQQIF